MGLFSFLNARKQKEKEKETDDKKTAHIEEPDEALVFRVLNVRGARSLSEGEVAYWLILLNTCTNSELKWMLDRPAVIYALLSSVHDISKIPISNIARHEKCFRLLVDHAKQKMQ